MKRSMFLIGLLAVSVMLFAGCSTITVKEFDVATGKITKETVTENTTVATIVTSTKDKSIFMWSSGWMVWIEGSPATTEEPTPHIKMIGGNIDKGMILLHKDQQKLDELADIIKATRSNMSFTASGANSTTPK